MENSRKVYVRKDGSDGLLCSEGCFPAYTQETPGGIELAGYRVAILPNPVGHILAMAMSRLTCDVCGANVVNR